MAFFDLVDPSTESLLGPGRVGFCIVAVPALGPAASASGVSPEAALRPRACRVQQLEDCLFVLKIPRGPRRDITRGTGPYRVTRFVPGRTITFERNQSSAAGAHGAGRLPRSDCRGVGPQPSHDIAVVLQERADNTSGSLRSPSTGDDSTM